MNRLQSREYPFLMHRWRAAIKYGVATALLLAAVALAWQVGLLVLEGLFANGSHRLVGPFFDPEVPRANRCGTGDFIAIGEPACVAFLVGACLAFARTLATRPYGRLRALALAGLAMVVVIPAVGLQLAWLGSMIHGRGLSSFTGFLAAQRSSAWEWVPGRALVATVVPAALAFAVRELPLAPGKRGALAAFGSAAVLVPAFALGGAGELALVRATTWALGLALLASRVLPDPAPVENAPASGDTVAP